MTMGETGGEDELDSNWVEETLKQRGRNDVPARLYKFVSADSKYFPLALHELLLHNRIYLSCRQDFNDPFDSSVAIEMPESKEEIEAFVAGFTGRNPDVSIAQLSEEHFADQIGWQQRAQAGLDRSFDSVGIYSLAESVKHPLMWAHYASAHRGIAIIFRHGVEGTFGAMPIRYQNEFPKVKVGADGFDVYNAFIKGESWAYENEWRMAKPSSARTWYEISSKIVVGIVLGARVAEETFQFVIDLVQRRVAAGLPPLGIYRASTGHSFDLQFLRLAPGGWESAELS